MTRVGVVYYPEGQGHATRMLGVVQALERRGAEVHIAGGGPGTKFVELQGYDVYRATGVEFIRDYQYSAAPVLNVLTGSLKGSCQRFRDLVRWVRRTDPEVLITDDMFAVAAATITRTPFYVVSHNASGLYDAVFDQAIWWGINRYQRVASREFLYPAVWPPVDDDPSRFRRIPPIALVGGVESGTTPDNLDVLVVPSAYSEGFGELSDHLRRAGYRVEHVGSDGWQTVPALLPWIRAADVVVCSGYSTVMEAAVAGTPCVIWPFTDEQEGVARRIELTGVRGFSVERSLTHTIRGVESPPSAPNHPNGIDRVAEIVLEDERPVRRAESSAPGESR
jgi:UDP:flavonoid glycosyltransferase YjiC (YdhE family)